jgi:hypothetical protein
VGWESRSARGGVQALALKFREFREFSFLEFSFLDTWVSRAKQTAGAIADSAGGCAVLTLALSAMAPATAPWK